MAAAPLRRSGGTNLHMGSKLEVMALNLTRIRVAASIHSWCGSMALAAWLALPVSVPGAGQAQAPGEGTYAAEILMRRQSRGGNYSGFQHGL